ncbi:MAG: hypothetical protein WCP28_01850 [Actinomycetes bacterium]
MNAVVSLSLVSTEGDQPWADLLGLDPDRVADFVSYRHPRKVLAVLGQLAPHARSNSLRTSACGCPCCTASAGDRHRLLQRRGWWVRGLADAIDRYNDPDAMSNPAYRHGYSAGLSLRGAASSLEVAAIDHAIFALQGQATSSSSYRGTGAALPA